MKTLITSLALVAMMAAPALAQDEPMPFPEYRDWVTTNLITEGDTGSPCNDPEAEPLVVTEEQLACYSSIVEAHAAIVPEDCYAEAYAEVQQYGEEGLGLVTAVSEMPASQAMGYVLMVTGSLWPELFPWAVVQPDPEAEPSQAPVISFGPEMDYTQVWNLATCEVSQASPKPES